MHLVLLNLRGLTPEAPVGSSYGHIALKEGEQRKKGRKEERRKEELSQ